MNELRAVGIDVSKAKLDVCCLYADDSHVHKVYVNDAEGIECLLEALRKHEPTAYRIVLESTGRYHLLVALKLSEAELDIRVINPLIAKRYTSSFVRKVKTDKADARVLAQIALYEQSLPRTFSSDKQSLQIKQKMGLLASLEKHLQALKASLKAYRECQVELGIETSRAEQALQDLVKRLNTQVKGLEQEITELILSRQASLEQQRLLSTIPGFSNSVAALVAELLDIRCTHPKQWIAYLGMDISVRHSGQWRGRGKLTKRGHPYLRKRLYHAAWGATMNYPEVKNYYAHLKQTGRNHVEALVIVARKLLRIAFAVLKSNTPYDPKCAFAY